VKRGEPYAPVEHYSQLGEGRWFMAFIPLIINNVFSDNRIMAGMQGRATNRMEQSMTNPTWARKQPPATRPAVKVTRVGSS
jgi:hypothetical protein